jgi:mannose-6-phosphate isomerase-like protein (cupin superfamily)
MLIRRVVTGTDTNGKSTIALDGPPSSAHEMLAAPGFAQAVLWSTVASPSIPVMDDPAPSVRSLHPEVGETRCLFLTLPPDSVMAHPDFDAVAFAREGLEHSHGIFDRMEPDAPGMHRTDTIDYVIVLEGEIWLELDDGRETRLARGDVVVQTGTRHAWRNKGQNPTKLFSVLIGAKRTGPVA